MAKVDRFREAQDWMNKYQNLQSRLNSVVVQQCEPSEAHICVAAVEKWAANFKRYTRSVRETRKVEMVVDGCNVAHCYRNSSTFDRFALVRALSPTLTAEKTSLRL